MKLIGKLNKALLEKEFGKLVTDEVVLTEERIEHIALRHPEDYQLLKKYGNAIITNPDCILKDKANENTVFFIKHIETINLNIIRQTFSDKRKHRAEKFCYNLL